MLSTLTLRTGVWYGDHLVELEIPQNWDVNVLWPQTPPPMSEREIADVLQKPIGQAPIQRLCRGKSRPLVIVDDLNRPTPTERIMPILLEYFESAGIPLKDVTILMATGSHSKPAPDAMHKKVGKKGAESCRLLIHDCFRTSRIGKTSFGTPVYVNRAVIDSDFVVGIGGIYPNHTAGFGGGTKLALGVLGIQTIFNLHFCHQGVGWGSVKVDHSFRKDLNEISNMIGLRTMISLQINADREIIRIDSGDPQKYYSEARNFARRTFSEFPRCDADVIISNTYPNDLSLTFAQMKGFAPFSDCKLSTSKIAIASCDEGLGFHNIFPFLNIPRFHRERQLLRRFQAYGLLGFSKYVIGHIQRKMLSAFSLRGSPQEVSNKHPIWLYRPGKHLVELPPVIPGIKQASQWSEVLQVIKREQEPKDRLKVIVYPCAFLQLSINSKESQSLE
jgi:nickel-dependent lactate racemase